MCVCELKRGPQEVYNWKFVSCKVGGRTQSPSSCRGRARVAKGLGRRQRGRNFLDSSTHAFRSICDIALLSEEINLFLGCKLPLKALALVLTTDQVVVSKQLINNNYCLAVVSALEDREVKHSLYNYPVVCTKQERILMHLLDLSSAIKKNSTLLPSQEPLEKKHQIQQSFCVFFFFFTDMNFLRNVCCDLI